MSSGPSKGSVAAILLLLFTGCGLAALQVCVCLGMGMGANCSYVLGPRSHTCKVAGSLGKGTRCLAFAVTHLAMTGPDSEERNRLFSRFAMGHKSRIGQCSEPVCPILPLLALGTLFGSPDIIIEANYSHFLAQTSRAGRMKGTEGKGPEKCFCLCAKVGHETEALPWTQKAGPQSGSMVMAKSES